MKKYYLWALPDAAASTRIQLIIQRLAQAFDGPIFIPHLTLYSGFVDVKRLKRVASGIRTPLQITLSNPQYGDQFFQKIHCPCVRPEHLSHWHQQIHDELNVNQPFFYPHLSLFYGNLTRFRVEDVLRGLNLLSLTFQVDRLAVVCGDENVHNWSLQSILAVSNA